MGPKPKAGGKKKKEPIFIEGVDTTEMKNSDLQQYMVDIYQMFLREREERSFFQLERDKLRTYLETNRNQLDEARIQLKTKEFLLENAETQRQNDVNEINQKVKYLQYEHSLALSQACVKEKDALLMAEKEFNEQQLELLADKKELKSNIKMQEEIHLQINKDIRLHQAEEKTEIRNEFEKRTEEMVHKFDKRMVDLKQQLERKQKLELNEVEERKNSQIMTLTQSHEVSFNDIRNYYNNITLNNFSLITNLKDNIEDMKMKDAVKENQLKELLKENKLLADAKAKETSQMMALKHQLANYRKETLKIEKMKREMSKAKIDLDKLTWDYEILNITYENYKNERTRIDLEKSHSTADLQKDLGGRTTILEDRVKTLKNQLEKREHVINEIRKILQNALYFRDRNPMVIKLWDVISTYDDSRARRISHRPSLFL